VYLSGTELGDSSRFKLFSISETREPVQGLWLPVISPDPSISVPLWLGSEAHNLLCSDRNFFTLETATSILSSTREQALLILISLKLGLSWGSWLQQCCINFFNSSKPGVSGLDGGTSSNEGRFCLSHTASQTIDVWITNSASLPASTVHMRIPKL
jgi:hypothetical protein